MDWLKRNEQDKKALVAEALAKASTFKRTRRVNKNMLVLKDFKPVIELALKADSALTLVSALKIINETAGTNVDRTTLYEFLKAEGLKRELKDVAEVEAQEKTVTTVHEPSVQSTAEILKQTDEILKRQMEETDEIWKRQLEELRKNVFARRMK
ncbi:MAG: hypothetical protein PUA61_00175 [Succinatimonas hippei]|nr:hypothetical protein [Succinatimonas hippei]